MLELRRGSLRVVLGLAMCASATALLWRVFVRHTLVIGAAVGLAVGATIGVLAAARRVPLVLRWIGCIVMITLTGMFAARSWKGPLQLGRALSTFLTIGAPAAGVGGLAIIPAAVALPGAALAVWGAVRDRDAVTLGGAMTVLVTASLLTVAHPLPILPVIVFVVLLVTWLVIARPPTLRLPPLMPGDPQHRRREWSTAAYVSALTISVGALGLVLPHGSTFDLRHFVHPRQVEVVDENPLARAARLRRDPPARAKEVALNVKVIGPSPGRMRVAVLDTYTPEGWHQSASFSQTGMALAANPAFPTAPAGATADVTVRRTAGIRFLRGMPTAGFPYTVLRPDEVAYATDAGVLLDRLSTSVRYRTVVANTDPPRSVDTIAGGTSGALSSCPASSVLQDAADALGAGVTSPVERLRRIESWLKLKRVYNPSAAGGQTLASIESFVGLDLAFGNMETFVTTFALLARCSGVPVRVVIGYPAPAGDATTALHGTDLDAWVEAPLAGYGWYAIDATPTPAEQQRQAELARQSVRPISPGAERARTPPRRVAPRSPFELRSSSNLLYIVGAIVLALATLWTLGMPGLIRRRRRRRVDPAAATLGAWDEVVDWLADQRVPLDASRTPSETVAVAAARFPSSTTALLDRGAELSDQARYDAGSVTAVDAQQAWAAAAAVRKNGTRRIARRLVPLRHPLSTWRRWRAAR